MKHETGFKNPVIAAQVQEKAFVSDAYQGHTMPIGKEFLGEKDFIGLEKLLAEIKNTRKKVILNMGDSSTSGWDSNIVTQNRDRFSKGWPLLSAYFQYKTYSDYLRDYMGEDYLVVNAGVPAHTSLQGYRRLQTLIQRFQKEGITIDWITLYYGNNDSVWDHNRQDKEWVGRKAFTFIDNLLKHFKKEASSVITRVSVQDYQFHMEKMIQLSQSFKMKIIIIEPITPIYWKPGTRVLNEDLERKYYPGSKQVYQLLDEGLDLWSKAITQNHYSDLKRALLEEIREKDYIVPRIKKGHLHALRILVQQNNVPYVQVNLDRSKDDICFFIDYCHPIGYANESLAHKIAEIVNGKSSGKEYSFRKIEQHVTPSDETKVLSDLPTEHYTLF